MSYTLWSGISRTSESGIWLCGRFMFTSEIQNPREPISYGTTSSTVSLQWSHPRSNPAQPVRSQGIIPWAIARPSSNQFSLPLWPSEPEILFVCSTSSVENIFSSALLWRHVQYISGGMRQGDTVAHFRNCFIKFADYKKIHEPDWMSQSSQSTARILTGYPEIMPHYSPSWQHFRNEIFNYKTSVMAMSFILRCGIDDRCAISRFPSGS
jgi:hypothetical protein